MKAKKPKHKPPFLYAVSELALAANNLLALTRLLFWVESSDDPEYREQFWGYSRDSPVNREILHRAEMALNKMGIKQETYEEFCSLSETIMPTIRDLTNEK